jgi:hypothetical protein
MSTGEPQEVQGTEAAQLGPNFIEQYGKQIGFGTIALVILFAAAAYMANTGRAEAEESWSKFASAQSAADFANVASDFAGTDVAVWARLTEGEMLLREAVQLQFSDRAAAIGQFKKAGEALDSVLGNANLPASAKERALLGKARLLETTSNGDMDEAIAAYEKVKGIQNSIYASLVDSRIEALKRDDTKSFYAWFSKQSPKPEDRARPQDGFPSGHPELPVTLPPIPEELFPANWSDLNVDDAPPFEIPAGDAEGTATEPADGNAATKDPVDGDAAPALKVPADEAAPADKAAGDDAAPTTDDAAPTDDAASESSTPE